MLPIIRPKLIGPCPLGRPLSPSSEKIIVVSDDDEDDSEMMNKEQTTTTTTTTTTHIITKECRITQVTAIVERQQNNHKKTVPLKT